MKLCDLKNGGESKNYQNRKNRGAKKEISRYGSYSWKIVKLERNAPLGDPQEYIVKGTGIAIRKRRCKKYRSRES